jgi:hypothetical protein
MRADLLRVKRLTVSASMGVGLVRFSATPNSLVLTTDTSRTPPVSIVSSHISPATHGSAELGGSLAFTLSDRWVLRGIGNMRLHAFSGASVDLPPNSRGAFLSVSEPAGVITAWRGAVEIGYRIGRFQASEPSATIAQPWAVGPLLAYSVSASATPLSALYKATGTGIFVSRRVFDWLDVDADLRWFPRARPVTAFDGGQLLQGVIGVRSGVRTRRLGVFANIGPGIARYSKVVLSSADAGGGRLSSTYGRPWYAVFKTGGIVEIYYSAHMLLRVEVATVHTFYHPITFVSDSESFPVTPRPGGTLQAMLGWALRFGGR